MLIPLDSAPRAYDTAMKFLHWLTLALIIAVFALASAIDLVPGPMQDTVTQLHRSIGLTIWVTTLARLAWRQFTRLPDWPASLSPVARTATKASEYGLYALLLLQPILGMVHTYADGEAVRLFLLVNIPAMIAENKPFAGRVLAVHAAVANALLVLIGLHVAMGLFRQFWRRDNALAALLPRGIGQSIEPQ
jgi:superoxide oxidase